MAVTIPRASQVRQRLQIFGPLGGREKGQELLISHRPTSAFAESFRLLALNVSAMLADEPSKAVVVMSAFPQDGRSLVATNLAIALAEQASAILVSGHDQKTSLASRLLLSRDGAAKDGPPPGLWEVPLSTNHRHVWLLPEDRLTENGSGDLERMMKIASEPGMFAVIDSPPAIHSSHSYVLAQKVGHVLYVVRRRGQDMEVHQQVRKHLERLNARVLGLVYNDV